MRELQDWTIFNPDDEASFDKEIANAIADKHVDFKQLCKKYDAGNTGFVSLDEY
jgi:hypothetical protein